MRKMKEIARNERKRKKKQETGKKYIKNKKLRPGRPAPAAGQPAAGNLGPGKKKFFYPVTPGRSGNHSPGFGIPFKARILIGGSRPASTGPW